MFQKTFLTGPAGTGKTTVGTNHLKKLITQGISPYNILVLVPQRTLGKIYRDALQDTDIRHRVFGRVDIVTPDGLAAQILKLVWPQVARLAQFGKPNFPPTFLNIEAVQYYMNQAITPLLRQGYFDPNVVDVTITLPRLMSQMLDNLEKSALIGIPHTEVGNRLKDAISMDISSRVAFDHMQECINVFRQYCLRHNLLDFSLRIETFRNHVWHDPQLRRLVTGRYRHVIVDNLEELNPFIHSMLGEWLPETESALLIYDEDAGFRIFLGANWQTAEALKNHCNTIEKSGTFHVTSAECLHLGQELAFGLQNPIHPTPLPLGGGAGRRAPNSELDPRDAYTFEQTRFHPQMLDWTIEQIKHLIVHENISPNEIVVLAPFVSDALRFSFLNKMERLNLPARSHRPSRPLKEEPAAIAVLVLARLIYPHWKLLPEKFDVTRTLNLTIKGLDLVRARLLVDVLYRPWDEEGGPLYPYEIIQSEIRERIGYDIGQRFDQLRTWLLNAVAPVTAPLDYTFSRLFGELLSQPGFGFYRVQEAGIVVANLVDSIKNFRRVTAHVPILLPKHTTSGVEYQEVLPDIDYLNREYVRLIEQGIVAALYARSWETQPEESVLLAPAHTFLMGNHPVSYQFWLDAGSSGWWERIAQPITHPHVLSASWKEGQKWTDEDEVNNQIDRLTRLILGLTRRCKQKIFIANSEISEQGYEARGRLLLALQQMLRRLQRRESTRSIKARFDSQCKP
ncbi:MAG: hypothetical protein B6242_02855 [Anaerolineaceae bacterium 4572_78]|nr:MAG: hypothetical protein B6242_02855 [Anaerolineaceae bacterium 4572_78]